MGLYSRGPKMRFPRITIKTLTAVNRGSLSFFEANKDVPFDIKRIYYTYQVPSNVRRGGHAHKKLTQLLFCPFGSIRMLLDDGVIKEEVLLDKPDKGFIISNGIWRELIWEMENSVLFVAASDYYDEADYIRDYDEFLHFVKKGH